MEQLFIQIFSEKGAIYLLFVIIVITFILKGVPFIERQFSIMRQDFLNALEKQQEYSSNALQSQQKTFEETLTLISDDYIKRQDKMERWHENHSVELKEIRNILGKK